MREIKVSVIIPIYNVEEYLEECLQSVVDQTLEDLQVIMVDDGSFRWKYRHCQENLLVDMIILSM